MSCAPAPQPKLLDIAITDGALSSPQTITLSGTVQ
jgi:hypothetical protein